jgi:hypothetical protein
MKKFEIFHHIDQKTIDAMYNDYAPIFILSTGRCGSLFIHQLLSQSALAKSYHEAFPNLMYFSNYAYHNQDKREVLKKMIQVSRMELILDAFNENRIYAESNQCLSFFTPALNDLFPRCKFIHLVRHPAEFVRSAVMKGWHLNDSIWESGRLKMRTIASWEGMSQIAKLAWLWKQTNRYLSEELSHMPSDRVLNVKTEDMFSSVDIVKNIYYFCEIDVPVSDGELKALMNKPVNELFIHPDEPSNMKKRSKFPKYNEWTAEMKKDLKQFPSTLVAPHG